MRILIVDDNEAIQEILSEILSVDGYETRTSSSLEDAADIVYDFRPDAILLDSALDGRDGLELVDILTQKGYTPSNVLVLASNIDQVPKDNSSIAGSIQKPFKSTEVLEKVRGLFAESMKEKPRRSLFRSLFGKKSGPKGDHGIDLDFGMSYLFVEQDGDRAYAAALHFLENGYDLMIMTSGKIKAAIERMNGNDVKVIGLSGKEGPDYVDPEKMGTIMGTITEFVQSAETPIIMIDDLDILVDRNGLNSVLTMMHQIIHNDSGKKLTLIASTAQSNMTEKDRELLLHSMEIKIFE